MFENVDVQTRNTSTQLRVFANEIESLEIKEVKQSEPIRFQTLQFASRKGLQTNCNPSSPRQVQILPMISLFLVRA